MSYWGISGSAKRFGRLLECLRYAQYLSAQMKMSVTVRGRAGEFLMSWKVHPDGKVVRHYPSTP